MELRVSIQKYGVFVMDKYGCCIASTADSRTCSDCRNSKGAIKMAYLFAAAPKLLKALKTIADQCGPYTNKGKAQLDYATIGNIARQAVAEAEKGE